MFSPGRRRRSPGRARWVLRGGRSRPARVLIEGRGAAGKGLKGGVIRKGSGRCDSCRSCGYRGALELGFKRDALAARVAPQRCSSSIATASARFRTAPRAAPALISSTSAPSFPRARCAGLLAARCADHLRSLSTDTRAIGCNRNARPPPTVAARLRRPPPPASRRQRRTRTG